jgi:hypothetical protein
MEMQRLNGSLDRDTAMARVFPKMTSKPLNGFNWRPNRGISLPKGRSAVPIGRAVLFLKTFPRLPGSPIANQGDDIGNFGMQGLALR